MARRKSASGGAKKQAAMRGYRVFVRDLVLPCRIGIHPHERELAQRVRFNVEIDAIESSAGDDIAGVVSYEDIVIGIKRIIGTGHINLVETLAEAVAELCLSDSRVSAARIRIEKLDVFREAGSVGVEIERRSGRR
ncbi:MAG: dihydroneopterin aldolase [Alphaproteobacteria bacterium]